MPVSTESNRGRAVDIWTTSSIVRTAESGCTASITAISWRIAAVSAVGSAVVRTTKVRLLFGYCQSGAYASIRGGRDNSADRTDATTPTISDKEPPLP